MKVDALQHRFTEYIPEYDDLEEGVLYVSIEYETVTHLCCCGCRNEVALPLDPMQWKLTFNGKAISLSPSVGNWSFPCRSHYWIKRNKVRWSLPFTDDQVARLRAGDRRLLEEHYRSQDAVSETESQTGGGKLRENRSWFRNLFRRRNR